MTDEANALDTTTSAPNKRIRKATTTEIIQINDLIKRHLTIHDGVDTVSQKRFVSYVDDWSDKKIAAIIGKDLSHHAVSRVRMEMYGVLRGDDGGSKTETRLARVENRMTFLEGALARIAKELGVDIYKDIRKSPITLNPDRAK